ncbi:class I SAM-dependent methyltransferase [Nocardioides sp. SYSU D00038]|uniref:class I SAM-dependent methyltransferase n=1 Tax=Nocardioides sp. SYSU D00038 TaxID=2812554 RepID=UPI0019687447|nr:class I SAM-dependent methyltransferase [Nocardioides sp. SYSU D00038]
MSDQAAVVQERINDYWSGRAPSYDAAQHRAERKADDDRAWAEVWSGALGPAPLDVLDVGTGSGQVACTLARLGHRVTGTDLATGMLARARARAAELPHPPTILVGDAVAPDFPDGSFDAVTARYLMWTLRRPEVALAAWRRVLRPGGLVAVVDSTWFPHGFDDGPTHGEGDDFVTAYDEQVRAALPLALADSIDDTAALLRATGLTDVTVTPLESILELDRRHGAAPGHEVQLQWLVTGRAPA